MELNQIRGQPAEPYHMASHFIRGFLDMVGETSHGFRRADKSWRSTAKEAAFLHAGVDHNEWIMAAVAITEVNYGTYENMRHGVELQDARHIYYNIGHRIKNTDPRGVTLKAELTDTGLGML